MHEKLQRFNSLGLIDSRESGRAVLEAREEETKGRKRNKIIVQNLLYLSPVRKKDFEYKLYSFVSSCIAAAMTTCVWESHSDTISERSNTH